MWFKFFNINQVQIIKTKIDFFKHQKDINNF